MYHRFYLLWSPVIVVLVSVVMHVVCYLTFRLASSGFMCEKVNVASAGEAQGFLVVSRGSYSGSGCRIGREHCGVRWALYYSKICPTLNPSSLPPQKDAG